MQALPRVSCIMPTYNRRAFVPQAIRYFLRQDYPDCELVIVDDGTDPVGDLVPDDLRIRYLRLGHKHTVGAKRNIACEEAKGAIIAHWDDDDWMADWRLRSQVQNLLSQQVDVCGVDTLLFYAPSTDRAWQYIYPRDCRPWLAGGTLCYTRALWQRTPFADVNVGEDSRFVWSSRPERMVALQDNAFYVALVHSGNTSPKSTNGTWWHKYPVSDIHRLLGEDLSFYRSGARQSEGIGSMLPAVLVQPACPSAEEGMEERSPAYSIIMVVHNARDMVQMSTLRTLRHSSGQDARLVVVDNASNDGTEVWLNVLSRRGDVDLIRSETNLGHGPAIELARQRTRSPYLVALDSDAFPLSDGWLQQLRARLTGNVKVAGIWHHRDYIHPSCLMVARETLDELGVTFLDEKDRPSRLDVAERISHTVKQCGYRISGLRQTNALMRGSISEPVYLGSEYEGLVYHHWYTTRAATAGGRQVDDVPPQAVERSLEQTIGEYHAQAREITVVVGIRAVSGEPQRLRNARAALWAINLQDLDRWRYRVVVIEQDCEPRLEDTLAPLADRYVFAYNPGPYNRGWAFNVGASLPGSETGVLCLLDADLLVPPDFLRRGFAEVQSGHCALRPYSGIIYLDAASTERAIRDRLAVPPDPFDASGYTGCVYNTSQGGVIWVDAGLYRDVGGHDECFRGWGFEDREFWERLARATDIKVLSGRLLHLDHPLPSTQDRWTIANRKRYQELSTTQPRSLVPLIGDPGRYLAEEAGPILEGRGQPMPGMRDWENWHRWTAERIENVVRDEQRRPAHRSARRCLAEVLCQLGDRILDLGCGPGALWPHLAPYRPRVSWVGLDVTYKMLRVANRLFPQVPLFQGDGSFLSFRSRSFDVVLLRHVLEHLPPELMRCTLAAAMRVARNAVVLDFYVSPVPRDSHSTTRVGANFLETRWTATEIEAPVVEAGWQVSERFSIAVSPGETDGMWILRPAPERDQPAENSEARVTSAALKVSVIMPTYRRLHTIFRTIDAIRAQTYRNWELIVIDNAGENAYHFYDPRIQVYCHTAQASASYARNAGLQYATGDLVCFFDDDDDMFPNYLERLVAAFRANPNAKMIRCGMVVSRGRVDYSYATPECCLRREYATATWSTDGAVQDQNYYWRIVSVNDWSVERGDIVTIHEALCHANADPHGGLRSGHY